MPFPSDPQWPVLFTNDLHVIVMLDPLSIPAGWSPGASMVWMYLQRYPPHTTRHGREGSLWQNQAEMCLAKRIWISRGATNEEASPDSPSKNYTTNNLKMAFLIFRNLFHPLRTIQTVVNDNGGQKFWALSMCHAHFFLWVISMHLMKLLLLSSFS